MHAPWEINDGFDVMDSLLDRLLASILLLFIFLAPPCSSFTSLRNLDIGGPLRPKGKPEENEDNAEVAQGPGQCIMAQVLINR
jgi:hypothetical protein